MQTQAIFNFYERHKEPFALVGLLQVGSTARGYSLDSSDVDLMAFYDAGPEFESYPIHKKEDGVSLTLEHHDLERFLRQTADYRFNLGSIRQLHKVRDSISVTAPGSIGRLQQIAADAHLDRTVLLQALAEIAERWKQISCLADSLAITELLKWTELLSTLDLVSVSHRPAYSKPKWLLRALREARIDDAVGLLNQLDSPAALRLEKVTEAVSQLLSTLRLDELPESFRLLVRTAANDVQGMLRVQPSDALPAARFFASQVLRSSPTETRGREEIELILRPNAVLSCKSAKTAFRALANRIAIELSSEFAKATDTAIGTRRFYTHFLETYNSAHLLPHNSLNTLRNWLQSVSNEFL